VPTPVSSPFILEVEPFVAGVNANSPGLLGLFWPASHDSTSSPTALLPVPVNQAF
jgi:hypothetical protein